MYLGIFCWYVCVVCCFSGWCCDGDEEFGWVWVFVVCELDVWVVGVWVGRDVDGWVGGGVGVVGVRGVVVLWIEDESEE